MAIIGNIFKIESFLKIKNLDTVFAYFKQSLEFNSEINRRIFELPIGSFEKVNITDEIFALEQVFLSKDRKDCFIESHKKYVDFQLILSGREQMEYIDIEKLEINTSYNENKDLITYSLVDNTSKFVMEANDLAVFFPEDGHVGMPKYKDSSKVYKTVVKVPVTLFQ